MHSGVWWILRLHVDSEVLDRFQSLAWNCLSKIEQCFWIVNVEDIGMVGNLDRFTVDSLTGS